LGAMILLVDDEPAFRLATRLYLEGKGYEVTEAEDGMAAMKLLASDPLPDGVILDINMPRVSGIDVLSFLHSTERTRNIPVVMLTARDDAETETLSWYEGCDWYQVKSKPIEYEDLGLVIERLLQYKNPQ